jgi:hypothetical protein
MPSFHFSDKCSDVRECWKVIKIGKTIKTDDIVDLRLSMFLNSWVVHHGQSEYDQNAASLEKTGVSVNERLVERPDLQSRQQLMFQKS